MAGAPVGKEERRAMDLLRSARRGNGSQVAALLRLGADVNARDLRGDTALHLASMNGHGNCVITLLDAGANVNTLGSKRFQRINVQLFLWQG